MSTVTKDQVIEYLSNISVLEMSELVKDLEEKFGVSAAAPAAVAAPAAGGAAPEAAGEQTEFTVTLSAAGDKKINVIKEVRSIMGLGLKEAKDFVEAAPGIVKEGVSKEEAEALKKQLEETGAAVQVS